MALERRAPLRRTPFAQKSPMPRSRGRTPRPRDTGPTKAVKDELAGRAGGCCEVCGRHLTGDWSRHHRRPRANGGTRRPETNYLSNLLLICGTATTPGGCHLAIESNRTWAYDQGFLVRQHHDPATTPVLYRGSLVLLGDDGTINHQEAA